MSNPPCVKCKEQEQFDEEVSPFYNFLCMNCHDDETAALLEDWTNE